MKISVTFRNANAEEDWQRDYTEEKLKKLKRYIDDPVEAHVVLSVEKFRNTAEINLSSNGLSINGREQEKDMRTAIDNAVDKIERQLKKRKEKNRVSKTDTIREIEANHDLQLEESAEMSDRRVVEVRKIVLNPMSIDDAVLEMETSKNRFLVYRDSLTEDVRVIYRRDDGKFVLLEISH
jgi:putative sigma-54 modulation protein